MFQLLLHHTYRGAAAAIDVSGANLHGVARDVSFDADGASADQGSLRFAQPTSRVSVADRPVLSHLHALKIEVVVRVGALTQRLNLVEGDNSFAFFINPNGVLSGTALGRLAAGAPLGWYGADTHINSPDGPTRLIPENQWVTLTYLHDGFASIRLWIDGVLAAANHGLHAPIQPVGSRGVHIGNWPAGDRYTFNGDIDDVKMWRWEPDAAYHHFFCRSIPACWKDIFGSIATWADGPDGTERLASALQCLGTGLTEIIREVRSRGEEAISRNDAFSREYRRLWCRGEIGNDEMGQVFAAWMEWIAELIGRERFGELIDQMRRCYLQMELLPTINQPVDIPSCDPEFARFIERIAALGLV